MNFKKNIFKFIVLLMCISVIFSVITACGQNDSETPANIQPPVEEIAQPEVVAEVVPAPTPEPTTPEPTEPPTTLEPIDPNLPYYEYLDIEFARFGFTDGDRISADTEEEIMAALRAKSCAKTEVDLSGEDVPFQHAYKFAIGNLAENFWDIAAELNFNSGKTLTEGDIIAGCLYVRDAGGPNPAQLYFAIKTPTNDWNGEGNMNISLVDLDAGEGWRKIYFHGESLCDENPASTAFLALFLGYDPHSIEIGGLYMMRYPGTSDNIKATRNIPY